MVKAHGVYGKPVPQGSSSTFDYTSHELQRYKRKHKFAVGMVYLHQHGLNTSRKVALERLFAGNSIVLDLLQLLCIGLVCLLLVLGDDL